MAKSKGARITITLECSCSNSSVVRQKGNYRYTTSKNRRNSPSRIELKKFCPSCNEHVLFKEIK